MIIRNLASNCFSEAIWQIRSNCRRALADGLKKSLKKKALRNNYCLRETFVVSAIANGVD